MIRDALLTALLIIAFILAPTALILFLLAALVLGVLVPNANWAERRIGGKFLLTLGVAAVALTAGIVLIIWAINKYLSNPVPFEGVGSPTPGSSNGPGVFLPLVIVALLAGTIEFGYQYAKFRTLSEKLRPGAAPIEPGRDSAETRISAVEAAQWGNVTLYGGENPFIGTGGSRKDWSIAIELRQRQKEGEPSDPAARGYVPIDPVELHNAIRRKLYSLNDPDLPANERVRAMTVGDHVVGSGRLRWDSPVVDIRTKTPYSVVTGEAIEALIRHPQAGLRYYQRVSVCDEGPPVMSNGLQVIDSSDQGIAISAFVYVAVEGRMFYIEFVRTALRPIKGYYQVIDNMPVVSSAKFVFKVLAETVRSLFGSAILAPLKIYAILRLIRWERRIRLRVRSSDSYVFGEFGAEVSVRELGAAPVFGTYIRELDVDKYTGIVERLLLDTVINFLTDKEVDTSAFTAKANSIITGNVYNVSGNQNIVDVKANAITQATGQGRR